LGVGSILPRQPSVAEQPACRGHEPGAWSARPHLQHDRLAQQGELSGAGQCVRLGHDLPGPSACIRSAIRVEQGGVQIAALKLCAQVVVFSAHRVQLIEPAPARRAGVRQAPAVVKRTTELEQQPGALVGALDQRDRRLEVGGRLASPGGRLGVAQFG
jgi:hypothetical protein